ncbi:HNH endonuclease family protein [Pseudooceanicola spongiae]|uniref:DUF1524 domain-containing protein n=1 Tax=Pseudooceanicola spongiae TaxID=2613965 RepID=A0A7M3V2S2_9RHOB|nr:HNH endonuclease family protein [Pseudooceanicola spongiae]QOL79385.1 DUF1524 domain-containing protein [Pseudooceanicola spongiae]
MLRFFFAFLVTLLPLVASAQTVKLTGSGICHDVASPWYERTRTFDPMPDMATCLKSGRAYSGYAPKAAAKTTPDYDRSLYGGWSDADSDCQNTRQELLAELSTTPVTWNKAGCTVLRGRWLDPYTGQIFLDASDLDIDHVVPLAYAHERGAATWTRDKRIAFANDRRNLFAVKASENRSKGAQGPAEWLPSDSGFQCQYMLRFDRIMKLYGLSYGEFEGARITRLREANCSGGTG